MYRQGTGVKYHRSLQTDMDKIITGAITVTYSKTIFQTVLIDALLEIMIKQPEHVEMI